MGERKKKRKSFSLDPSVAEQLDSKADVNASSLVESLLQSYLNVGDTREAALQKRIRDKEAEMDTVKQEISELESRLDTLERQRDQAVEQLQNFRNQRHDDVIEVAALVRSKEQPIDREDLDESHELVASRASSADLSPSRFLKELDAELEGRDGSQ